MSCVCVWFGRVVPAFGRTKGVSVHWVGDTHNASFVRSSYCVHFVRRAVGPPRRLHHSCFHTQLRYTHRQHPSIYTLAAIDALVHFGHDGAGERAETNSPPYAVARTHTRPFSLLTGTFEFVQFPRLPACPKSCVVQEVMDVPFPERACCLGSLGIAEIHTHGSEAKQQHLILFVSVYFLSGGIGCAASGF